MKKILVEEAVFAVLSVNAELKGLSISEFTELILEEFLAERSKEAEEKREL